MYLNINQNYQSQNFRANKYWGKFNFSRSRFQRILSLLGLTAAGTGTYIDKDNTMSASELSGRVQVINDSKETDFFNQEVSFNYFAKGKLKDIPEYLEAGRQAISLLDDDGKENRINTLEWQEQIVDKILSEDVLINNSSIRNNLYNIVNKRYDYPVWNLGSSYKSIETTMQAQLKFLDLYARDTNMQQNKYINENIGQYIFEVGEYWPSIQAKGYIIQLLKDNAENTDEEFFNKLQELLSNGVCPDCILKVLSNKKLYKNDALYSFIYKIKDMLVSERVIKILNNYEDNYSDSELVNENIGYILSKVIHTFNTDSDSNIGSYEKAEKMMQELAEKEKQQNSKI